MQVGLNRDMPGVLHLCIYNTYIIFILFYFIYVPNVRYNIHSKSHNATGRTDRWMYRTYVCPSSRLTYRVKT